MDSVQVEDSDKQLPTTCGSGCSRTIIVAYPAFGIVVTTPLSPE